MKKFVKMSLVAAVAVAGLTSTISAKDLSEAIKNTDISGKVYVEYLANTAGTTNQTTSNTFDIDVDVTLKSKVNDNLTAVVRAQADQENAEGAAASHNGNADVDNVYFSYVNGSTTANFGKMDINTPSTDGENGSGFSVSKKVGPATLIAQYFATNELTAGDIYNFAALASISMVNVEAWYTGFSNDSVTPKDGGKNFTLAASTTIEGVALKARYATTDYNTATAKDGGALRFDAATTISGVSLNATYFSTDKNGAAYTTDPTSANTYELSQLGAIAQAADVSIWAVGAAVPVSGVTLRVDYADFEEDINKTEATELRFRAIHSMSSNATVMATYSMYELENSAGVKTADSDSARIEITYKF